MTNDQETEIHRAIKTLRDETILVNKNINFIGFTLVFVALVVVAHVWHHW